MERRLRCEGSESLARIPRRDRHVALTSLGETDLASRKTDSGIRGRGFGLWVTLYREASADLYESADTFCS
ncbi:unnamed protein product [Lampetra planeri]